MAECSKCGAENIPVSHCHECGYGIDKEQIRASWHRDGH